jgi:YVTN family beta-propeller protein
MGRSSPRRKCSSTYVTSVGTLIGVVIYVLIAFSGWASAIEPAYLSPSAIVADKSGTTLYVAEQTANVVAVFDIAAARVKKVFSLPDSPGGLAISPDESHLYVTGASPAGKVYVVDLPSGEIVNGIAVGHTPVSPIVSADGKILYVCNRFSNTVSVIDLAERKEAAVISVPREPVDAALTPDGKWLLVANLLPAGPANVDYVSASVSIIDTGSRKLVKDVLLPNGSAGVQGICLSPDGRYAYAVHIRGHFQVVTVQLNRGWMNTNVLSVIDVEKQSRVDTVVLDDRNLGAANPWDIVCSGDGRYLVVSHAGTHELSVIDRAALHARLEKRIGVDIAPERRSSFQTGLAPPDFRLLAGLRSRVKLEGNGPRGLAIVGTKVYAAEYFSDSIGVAEVGPKQQGKVRSLALGPSQPLSIERRGEMLFHDASHSFQQWQSCSTCHTSEGRPDGLNWDLLNDGVFNPKNTKSLLLAHKTPPAMITGVRDRAEIAVRAGIKFILFAEWPEADAAAIDAYLKSLTPVPSPYLVNGKLSRAAERGKRVFQKAGCASCHSGPLYTNLRKADVGTGTGNEAHREFDTPTLIEVWRTGPYLYDGRASTMKDVLTRENPKDAHGVTSRLTQQEIEDLAEFVLSL